MAVVTYFVALPFVRNENGELVAGEAQERQSAGAAKPTMTKVFESTHFAFDNFEVLGRDDQGQRECAFILALVEAGTKDISLAEIVERLEAERDVRVGITSVWKFLDRHGLTYKKRPRTPPSSSARTSARRGRPGSTASSTSIPTS